MSFMVEAAYFQPVAVVYVRTGPFRVFTCDEPDYGPRLPPCRAQNAADPAQPTDYIAFVRGVPAAARAARRRTRPYPSRCPFLTAVLGTRCTNSRSARMEIIGYGHSRKKEDLLRSAADSGSLDARAWWGLALLGFTSLYREGFEVVLFLQSYRLRWGNARGSGPVRRAPALRQEPVDGQ
jgi:hypothetical protein